MHTQLNKKQHKILLVGLTAAKKGDNTESAYFQVINSSAYLMLNQNMRSTLYILHYNTYLGYYTYVLYVYVYVTEDASAQWKNVWYNFLLFISILVHLFIYLLLKSNN